MNNEKKLEELRRALDDGMASDVSKDYSLAKVLERLRSEPRGERVASCDEQRNTSN